MNDLKRVIVANVLVLALGPAAVQAAEPAPTPDAEAQALFDDALLDTDYAMRTAKDQYDEALQVAEKAIKSAPDNAEWRRRAARSAELAGKRELALNHWLYLVERGDGTARQSALRLTRSMHEFPIRRRLLEDLLRAGNGDAELLIEYLSVCETLGVTREAYNLLSSKFPFDNQEALLKEKARVAEALGKPLDAVNALDLLAQIRPLTSEELLQRSSLQFGVDDLQRDWQQAFGPTLPEAAAADARTRDDDSVSTASRRSYRWREARRMEEERRYVGLDATTLGATVKYEFNQDERRVSGTKTTDTAHTITERLELNSGGFLYHPAFFKFGIKAAPEYTQRFTRYSGNTGERSERTTSISPNYQVHATMLSEKPYTLTMFSHHLEAQTWASYSGTTTTTTDSHGADLALKYNLFPTSLGFSTSSSEQQGYYRSSSDWNEFHLLTTHNDSITGESSLSSTYSDNDQVTNDIATSIKTFNSIFSNQMRLTSDERLRLSSNLQYTYQDATSNRTKSLFLTEHLGWRHLPNLQSQYLYHYRQVDSTLSDNTWQSLEARLTHTLYENLTTMAAVSGSRNEVGNGRQDSLSGMLTTDYRRRLGTWGNLGLTAGLNEQYSSRSGSSGEVQISSEPHVLGTGNETYLDQPDVNLDSIIVTNSSGGVIYMNGIDYRVDLIGNSVLISRLPLGSIGEGQLVLVSYRYVRSSGYDDQVLTQQYGATVELFRSLFFGYRYLQANQTIVSGPPPDRLSNSRIHLATVRFDEGWGESAFVYEDAVNNSDVSYTRWEASQWFRLRYANRLQANLRGYYGETDYRSYDDHKTTFGGATSLYWSLASWFRLSAEAYLERVDGRLQRAINAGGKADLEASYRLWSAKIGYKYTDQNDQISNYNRRNHLLQFQISRGMW